MSKSRPRLYLIDGSSNIFRAFYAIRDLSNSKGEPTNAVYGFIQMLRKLLRDEKPDFIGVAMDVSRKTVRSEKYAEYKANRKPMPDELRPQIPLIRRALEGYNIPILELERYEADDVLGTLAKKASAEGYEVVLVSADKDLMQLVDENVLMMHTSRDKLYDPALVEKDFGVPPNQVIDVLALEGDSSDNVPGVKGIGAKGARQLIGEYGSLDALLDAAADLKQKRYREGLTEQRDAAILSKELVTIHTDLPVEFQPEELALDPPNQDALRELFREMEFFSLIEELEAGSSDQPQVEPAEEILTATDWTKVAARLAGDLVLGLVGDEAPLGLAVAGLEGSVFYVDFRREEVSTAVLASLVGWSHESRRKLTGHDLKEVLRLVADGNPATAGLFDTMLVSYVLRPALRAHTLPDVALERLGHQALSTKDVGWSRGEEPPLGSEALLLFAGERVDLVRRLAPNLRKELESGGDLAGIYDDLERPLLPVLLGMEESGILLDTEYLGAMSRELGDELTGLEREIYELAGEKFNINSPRQLGEILFERLGYPVIKKTRKTKSYSTGAETLQALAAQGYPLPERLLRFRELSKLKSTYVDALPELVGDDGRLHTRFYQAVAATGRLSSANPNLQNIPVRTELGQRIRKAFRAPEGSRLLVADYNQIELRVLAHIAEEEALIEAFERGDDIHQVTAAAVLGVAPELVTSEQRRAAKAINFGIIYGMSAYGLSRNLDISPGEADGFIRAYFDRYPGVERYMEETFATAEAEGKVATLYGRVRWLPDIKSRNRNLRENARRMAINARIQGTAADLLKKAMISVDSRLRAEFPGAKLLLTVHDELVLEVNEPDVEAVSDLVTHEMESVEKLRVPLTVDIGSGPTWYDSK